MTSPHLATASMTEGPVPSLLARLTIPMVLGLVSILLFNLVDALYVGHLGVKELAALSFTFPVSFVLVSTIMGLGIGTSALVSRALGAGNIPRFRQAASCSLVLAFCCSLALADIGSLLVTPLFRLLGADASLIPLIDSYMQIWYGGIPLLAIPLVGNSIIRATGNMRIPSYLMMASAFLNAVLDPLFIFGYAGFPAMGLAGAALATVIAWAFICCAALWVLAFRLRLITLSIGTLQEILDCWRSILHTGLPAATSNILIPISAAMITALLAQHGPEAVAGFGVGSRMEPLALVVIMALSSVITPFIGQNIGAGKHERVHQAMRLALNFALSWGALMYGILALGAVQIGQVFSKDETTSSTITLFLWTLPISYAFQGVTMLVCSGLNAVRRAPQATLLQVFRLFVLYLPLASLGSYFFGVWGIFLGASAANIIMGLVSFSVSRRTFS